MVSSTVIILSFGIICTMQLPKKEDLPLLLVPAMSIVLEPSMRNHISAAANGLSILLFMNNGSVHGLSLCRLMAKPSPSGDSVLVMAAILALPPGADISVSSTGFASSSGRPLVRRNLVAQDSASSLLGMMFVSHCS